jgi:poly(3-hydroxybutyrate) depolymerase
MWTEAMDGVCRPPKSRNKATTSSKWRQASTIQLAFVHTSKSKDHTTSAQNPAADEPLQVVTVAIKPAQNEAQTIDKCVSL